MKNVASPQESEHLHRQIVQRLSERTYQQQIALTEINNNLKLSLERIELHRKELVQQLGEKNEALRALGTQFQTAQIELNRYRDMLKGIGSRPLRWSLGVGRRVSRVGRGLKSLFKRQPKNEAQN